MSRKILVPVDGSPLSRQALEHSLEEFEDATVVALHVLDPSEPGYSTPTPVDVRTEPPQGSEEWYERAHEEEESVFEEVREIAAEYDAEVTTESTTGEPSREIVDYAEENDVDHVVIGSHGRTGPTRLLLGSVAEVVVRRAPVSVTVVRDVEAL
ncbi:Nucleotide-binding universal stress protein, UspA family [Halobiforma haloterrestris]|uniref:Nucleotide-binding universal stress protein, UspA family n=1 Tax=Natronobacterium haloterrestre TaxID=148448 RepID=A0A1I1KL34_NATHA|nr:universal stress protein [Halobiforma haloterrestris]SFC61285.1 Nucleotide-binding universal stress protein, UspA family [Halobiforma haloterrestris]